MKFKYFDVKRVEMVGIDLILGVMYYKMVSNCGKV